MIANSMIIGLVVLINEYFNPTPVHAYLDPGTGSVILQGVLGAIAAIAVVVKLYWHRILRFLGMSKKPATLEQKAESGEKKS